MLCLALPGLTISPVYGQEARSANFASSGRVPSNTSISNIAQPPAAVRKGLRYFRFSSCQRQYAAAAPREIRAESRAGIILPDTRATGEAVRRRAGQAGMIFTETLGRLQAFGNWCRNTGLKVANLYNTIADSCRRLQRATAAFSSAEAQAAALPAPAGPAVCQASFSSDYRCLWKNDRGDCIYSLDAKFDPNRGGPPVWRRIK